MAVYKMPLEDFDEIDYELIAIHSQLEDYRLAYYINQNLPINLKKSISNIHISSKEGETEFSRFIFEDEKATVNWTLIQNQNNDFILSRSNNLGLFANSNNEFSKKIYLIPEYKKVDYFLKIENSQLPIATITNSIKKIDRVSTVYSVEVQKIKSKNNLIF